MTPTPELEAAVERLREFPAGTEGVQSKYVLVHQLRASADIQDVATKRETGWATTSDRADLMRRAANAIERLASLPTGDMASTSAAVTYTQAEFDESYEIGVRDGYESAVQDIDLATGGDGEFRWSSDPDRSIDVPAMKARIIERLSPISETGDMASRDHAPGERSPANPETLELTTALLQGLRRATREQREFIPTRAAILTFFPGADFDEALRRAKGANALLTQASLPTGTGEGEWHPAATAPHACHVHACRFDPDAGEWVHAIVLSPPTRPFTHWRPLPPPPHQPGA